MTIDEEMEVFLEKNFGYEKFNPDLLQLEILCRPLKSKLKEKNVTIVTIGGTNGKGEVAHGLYDLFLRKGSHVGLWTSPHLLSLCERFQFSDGEITPIFLKDFLQRKIVIIEGYSLSYYEYLFYCFLDLASSMEKLEIVILEVGLGGRQDAVNILDPHYTALTSLSHDHEEFLGDDLSMILKEKMAIGRRDAPFVFALEQKHLRDQMKSYCDEERIPSFDLFDLEIVSTKMLYDERNNLLSSFLFHVIERKDGTFERTFLDEKVSFRVSRGRRESLSKWGITFLFIGAHNLDGMIKMFDFIKSQKNMIVSECLVGFSVKKSRKILELLILLSENRSLLHKITSMNFPHHKSHTFTRGEKLFKSFRNSIDFIDDYNKKMKDLSLEKKEDRTILVTGSYYFIGTIQKYIFANQ